MTLGSKQRICVLVVEDECLLRMDAADIVEDAGFEVIEAGNADEAMTILEARSDIRIIFTDIEMPGSMNGITLARTVRDRWPPMQIIVASGRIVLKDGELPDHVRFLRKPYQPTQIRDALKRNPGH